MSTKYYCDSCEESVEDPVRMCIVRPYIRTELHFHQECASAAIRSMKAAGRDAANDESSSDDDDQATVDPWRDRDRYGQLPMQQREHIALNVLAGRRMRVRELVDCVAESHPELSVDGGEVQQVLYGLMKAGQVDRKRELLRPRGKRVTYRYFLRQTLDGPIADLERAFHEGSED